MDSRKCQTVSVSPAEPGNFLLLFNANFSKKCFYDTLLFGEGFSEYQTFSLIRAALPVRPRR